MASSTALIAVFAFAYLLGSIPFGLLLTRAAGLGDVRSIGSGNIGATNVLRTGHRGLAAATLLLDALKGTAAVVLAAAVLAPVLLKGPPGIVAGVLSAPPGDPQFADAITYITRLVAVPWIALLGAIVGHVYPVWLGFKGGKGVATYIGALAGAHLPAALVFAVAWLVVAAAFRRSSLAALIAIGAVVAYFALESSPQVLTAVVLASALIVYKHKANIGRLIRGEEPRIGAKAS
jgi:glycerol-3-phosphate acyltransferase PlsY